MYGNAPFGGPPATPPDLSPKERQRLRRDLSRVVARTRELLPDEFVVGSELTHGAEGLQATVAVQPPVGSVVSAGYTPDADADVSIGDDERDDLAAGLAASAALQVKRAMGEDAAPAAR